MSATAGDLSASDDGGIDLGGDDSSEVTPLTFGDALPEGEDEIAFDTDEGGPGFDTVNLDTGFEETRPIPEDVEGYALDQESAEAEEAPELAAATPPTRPARRKPSLITNVIGYLLGLLVALPLAYAILLWFGKTDPLSLAPSLPSWAVPAQFDTKAKLAAAAVRVPLPSEPNAGLSLGQDAAPQAADATTDDNATPGDSAAGNSAAGDLASDTPAGDETPDDATMTDSATASDAAPGDDATATDDNAASDSVADDTNAADMPDDSATASDDSATASDEPDAADTAAMAADAATHDPDAVPGELDQADTDAADADATASDDAMPDDAPVVEGEIIVGDVGAPTDDAMPDDQAADATATDDMPADSDATAESTPADSDATPDSDATAESTPADSDATDKAAMADDADADDATETAANEPAADDSAVGTALDDAMVDDKAAEPETVVGPRDSVQYSPDDVDRALTELASAAKAMDGAAKADMKKAKGQYYRKLYQLAEVATFTPSMVASAEAEQGSQQDVVYHTLTGSAADSGKFAEVGKAAAQWLAAIKGKEHQGIVLTGTIKSTRQRGEVFETQVLLTDGQSVVTVLSPAAPTVGPRGAVLVWGSVADDPAQSIAGYEGDAPTAVWTPGIEAAPPGAARTGNAATSERR